MNCKCGYGFSDWSNIENKRHERYALIHDDDSMGVMEKEFELMGLKTEE